MAGLAFQWSLAALETLMAEDQMDQHGTVLRAFSVVELWRLRRVCRAFHRWGTAALAALPRVVAVGGRDTYGEATASVEVLDLSTLRWSSGVVPALPEPRASHSACAFADGRVVVAGVPFRTSYAAAKAGMVSFTRSWALELAPFGITVNSVAPGPVETELFNTNNPPGSESRARYIEGVPMKRVGSPEELAAANCYFLVGQSGFTTGQTLFVDGGYMTGKSSL